MRLFVSGTSAFLPAKTATNGATFYAENNYPPVTSLFLQKPIPKMHKPLILLCLLFGLLTMPAEILAQPSASSAQAVAEAERAFGHLKAARGDSLHAMMTPQMQRQVSPLQCSLLFMQLTTQMGKFVERGPWEATQQEGYDMVSARLHFSQKTVGMRLAFDAGKRIAGLFFVPVETGSEKSEPLPAEADSAFVETDTVVLNGDIRLPATYCRPQGASPVACVVLVHGSGPNDRDETLGPNKMFRDLAHRLAEAGIATLRYDKRTYVYRQRTSEVSGGTLNYDTETVNDAVAAVRLAASLPGVDARRVFVAGHSLGGLLAPRIARRCSLPLAGMLSLSGGPIRSFKETLRSQLQYIVGLQGGTTSEVEAAYAKTIATLPEDYLTAAEAYDFSAETASTDTPFLLLQGGCDYQITTDDFALWQSLLKERAHTSCIVLPHCDHLLRHTEAMATPQSYMRHLPLSADAVALIVAFVQNPKQH